MEGVVEGVLIHVRRGQDFADNDTVCLDRMLAYRSAYLSCRTKTMHRVSNTVDR